MYISIRTKLIALLVGFTILLLGIAAYLFTVEKTREITHDIFLNTIQFANLSAEKIVSNYDMYLEEGGFVYFNRDIRAILVKNENVYGLKLVNYKGEIVYDSEADRIAQYEGKTRFVEDPNQLYQIQSVNPSLRTFDGRIIYLKVLENGGINYVDDSEKEIEPFGIGDKFSYYVEPAGERFAVVYEMTYENLADRIALIKERILYLALFGVLIGILMAFVFSGKMSKSIKILAASAGVIATGNFRYKVYLHTNDELEMLGNAFNKMGSDLEESTKAIIYKEQVKKELELAASIQNQLLPKELPRVIGMDCAAGIIPAEEIGGDLYDFIIVGDSLIAYIGDVTGHGVPASLVGSVANALFYTFAQSGDIKKALIDANKILKVKTTTNMFITLCMVHFDVKIGKMNYVSAGHEKILLFKAKSKKVMEMPAGGMALGMMPDVSSILRVVDIPMEKDDVAVLYSDGIPEAWKSKTESYGMPNLKRAVSEYSDLPTAEAIKNALLADVKEFCGKYEQKDDMTVLVFKRH